MATSWKDLLSTFDTKSKVPAEPHQEMEKPEPADNCISGGGIIYTDTSVLSTKFGVGRDIIQSRLQSFIRQCKRIGRNWLLLDASNPSTSIALQTDRTWYSYHKLLHSFIRENELESGVSTSVFIIGGNDVIAVPELVFNLPQSFEDFLLQIDLWYCFPVGFNLVEELESLAETHELYDQDLFAEQLMSHALCNVSRLPLDDGNGCGGFEETIGNYLDRVITSQGNIYIDSVLMTTASQWLKESSFMLEGMPLLPIHEAPSFTYRGMYVAPYLSLQNREGMNSYCRSLEDADYLLFNMHGSDQPSVSGYLGIGPKCEAYIAFDIPLLDYCKSKALTATACFGARYKGYGLRSSLLLSSIYQNFLLFTGSSHIAMGAVSEQYPCGCSETLMKYYTNLLLYGVPAGEALLRSKIEYFTSSYPRELDYSYFTICEFNVFGDPSLECICHNNILLSKLSHPLDGLKQTSRPGNSRLLLSLDEAYERVHNLVDNNLEEIAIRLGEQLITDYSFVNLEFNSAEKRIKRDEHIGYVFVYSYANNGKVFAHTDLKGKLSIAFYTK